MEPGLSIQSRARRSALEQHAGVAQLAERLFYTEDVGGSSPSARTDGREAQGGRSAWKVDGGNTSGFESSLFRRWSGMATYGLRGCLSASRKRRTTSPQLRRLGRRAQGGRSVWNTDGGNTSRFESSFFRRWDPSSRGLAVFGRPFVGHLKQGTRCQSHGCG